MIGSVLHELRRAVAEPTALFAEIRSDPAPRRGLAAVLVVAIVWTLFTAALYMGGWWPSRGIGLWSRIDHYLYQCFVLAPALAMAWWIYAQVASRVVGATGPAARAIAHAWGPAFSAPVLVAYLLPDIVVFYTLGFDALRFVARVAPLVVLLWTGALGIIALRQATACSWGRAAAAHALAFIAHSVPLALLIR